MGESFTPPEVRPSEPLARPSQDEINARIATAKMVADEMPKEYGTLWRNFKSYAEGTVVPPIEGWTQEDCQQIFREMPQPSAEIDVDAQENLSGDL